jgi:hypothetical protein
LNKIAFKVRTENITTVSFLPLPKSIKAVSCQQPIADLNLLKILKSKKSSTPTPDAVPVLLFDAIKEKWWKQS